MYADDLAQAAKSVDGLQQQLLLVDDYAARWGLTINASKTRVVVFARRRDKTAAGKDIEIFVNGEKVEVMDNFTYLGVAMHSSSTFGGFAAPKRKDAGRKAMHGTRSRMSKLKLDSPKMMCQLFDVVVEPVLSYGAEIWAPEFLCCADPCNNPPEEVQLAYLKGMFGVRQSTASDVVLAEAGRKPLAERWIKRLAKFYTALVRTEEGCLLKRSLMVSWREVPLGHLLPVSHGLDRWRWHCKQLVFL
jgi:hypothetical protein